MRQKWIDAKTVKVQIEFPMTSEFSHDKSELNLTKQTEAVRMKELPVNMN